MSSKSNIIFKGLYIVAWIIFVGLCIEAGGLIVNFIFTIYNPEFIPNLYQKLDLSEMYNRSEWAFFIIYSLILVIAVLKACLFYIVIRLMHRFDFTKPFNRFVSKRITEISYYTFSIGILSYTARQIAENIHHKGFATDKLNEFFSDSQAFILMAAVIYIIANIFKRGIELQTENDLTI
ncbi:MAG TPA: DUF2975 domain-containing protein [Niabella sp.]|nr:DUF2975 domain-containing protein [Niabella sp.]